MRVGSDVQFDCPQVRLNGLRIPVPGLVAAKPSRGVLSAVCEELRDEYNWAMAGFIMAGISWIAMPLDPIAAGATGLAGADVQHILNQMKADGCAK